MEGAVPAELGDKEPHPGYLLESVLEGLDEEYAGDDPTLPTDAMKAAAYAFCTVIRREYRPWTCEVVARETVNVREWVAEHRPDWLAEGENAGGEP